MSGPLQAEWMLWAKRFMDEHAKLLERIKTLETECVSLKGTANNTQRDSVQQTKGAPAWGQLQSVRGSSEATTVTDAVAIMEQKPIDEPKQIRQGAHTLLEYLQIGEVIHVSHERKLVEAFLSGMASIHQQAALESVLEKEGWTWENVFDEIQRVLADQERRRKKRRSLAI